MSSEPQPPEYPLPKYEYDPPPGCLVVVTIVSVAAGAGWLVGRWSESPTLALAMLAVLVLTGLVAALATRVLPHISSCGCLVVILLTCAAGALIAALLRRPPAA